MRDLNLEEKDVLGAFVTFNYIKFKDFVSQEYRFSQLFLLGSFLQGEDQRFEGNALKIDEAPLPSAPRKAFIQRFNFHPPVLQLFHAFSTAFSIYPVCILVDPTLRTSSGRTSIVPRAGGA